MKKRSGFGAELGHLLGADEICGSADTVILRGTREAEICGCRGILLYGTQRIRLLMHGGVLELCGSELYCASYYRGAVRIDGCVRSVEYLEEML